MEITCVIAATRAAVSGQQCGGASGGFTGAITAGISSIRQSPFFFTYTATTDIYTLSLHDALPILDLHNLMHFLSLRADAHAQYEIRVYADVMIDTLKRWTPICHDAFMEYRMGGAHLSKTGLAALKRMVSGEKVDQKSSGLNPREWRELMAALGLPH